jgi:hypothetical protein
LFWNDDIAHLFDFIKASRAVLLSGQFTHDSEPMLYFSMDCSSVNPQPFLVDSF